jgi:hypothetical protein
LNKPITTDERLQQLLEFGLTEQEARDQIRNETLIHLVETADTLEALKSAIRRMLDDQS